MNSERLARTLVLFVLLGIPSIILVSRLSRPGQTDPTPIVIHGRMPEDGGWMPMEISARVGEPLDLRLTSDDVVHGFAIGHTDIQPVDVKPGEVIDITVTFDQPGKYVYYCTRWCGVNHWRMRGTIEVTDDSPVHTSEEPPLYVRLGLDIDAPHAASITPHLWPDASFAVENNLRLPPEYTDLNVVRARAPEEIWLSLRIEPAYRNLDDEHIWDLVALVYARQMSPETLEEGKNLYGDNCAACHGESGDGEGVMASALFDQQPDDYLHQLASPTDFTDPGAMLGASSALYHGKIIRGGMGTGMPYFGPILTDDQIWALVDYLWTFQFDLELAIDH